MFAARLLIAFVEDELDPLMDDIKSGEEDVHKLAEVASMSCMEFVDSTPRYLLTDLPLGR